MDLSAYRSSPSERARTEDLLRLIPRTGGTVLDVGARDGHFSLLLADLFDEVTALDLTPLDLRAAKVKTVVGDVTQLQFPDDTFDCVFCAEVLEHIPDLEAACREIARVARRYAVIGVPFRQDTRVGRTTCSQCGKHNPPWGHVNTFDENKLQRLFSGLVVHDKSFIGANSSHTNPVSTWLMDYGRNPWGTYNQQEPCVHCGALLLKPDGRTFSQRLATATAFRLNTLQKSFVRPHANWIHAVFKKTQEASNHQELKATSAR